jgi:hypothetical protein
VLLTALLCLPTVARCCPGFFIQHPRLVLRRWWLGFTPLILAGLLSQFVFSEYSLSQLTQWHFRSYTSTARHAALFGLLVTTTYVTWRPVWWFAVGFISLKLYWLLKYYLLFDYVSSSTIYQHDYWVFFYKIGQLSTPWLALPGDLLFSNNLLSAAFLTTLYVYWLVQCGKLLQAESAG